MTYRVAVVGATGAVGQQMLKTLARRKFPATSIRALASARSAGTAVTFNGQALVVEELTESSFQDIDVALFSAGGGISERFAPIAAQAGAVVIDNTSAFRMDPQVPLVVPEVNAKNALEAPKRIIANPNCSTIQMVVALAPLHRAAQLKRVVVSTYQAAGGAGAKGISELEAQARAIVQDKECPPPKTFPHPLYGECLPEIGEFNADGYSTEERKMIDETRKILELPELKVTATTVRVPVRVGHSESINVEFQNPLDAAEARRILSTSDGVTLLDRPERHEYPLARLCEGTDPVYVGRIRNDSSAPNALNLWVVADNLLKGAALNAVQIAEFLHNESALKRP